MLYALASSKDAKFTLSFFDNSRHGDRIAIWLHGNAQINWAVVHFNDESFWVAQKDPENYTIVGPWREISKAAFVFILNGKEFTPPSIENILDQYAL